MLQVQTRWIPEIQFHRPNTPVILMACKTDCRKDANVIERLKYRFFQKPLIYEDGEQLAKSISVITYLESSALEATGNVYDFAEIVCKAFVIYQQQVSPNRKDCLII